jgi:hypothetical protein
MLEFDDKNRIDISNYPVRIIVAGSRFFNDKWKFHNTLLDYIKRFSPHEFVFISGKAPSGADDLIIQWCEKFKYPYTTYKAYWDKFGKSAGYKRNAEMAGVATHLLAYYNGTSPGTKHMVDLAEEKSLSVTIINI